MARIRTIKPEFPHSESMGRVSRDARLTFILLWTIADDDGRLRGNSRMLASLLYPYDKDASELISSENCAHDRENCAQPCEICAQPRISVWLDELEREKTIVRYEVNGSQYIQILNWLSHQRIDHPTKSKIPPPKNSRKSRESSRKSLDEQRGIRSGSKDLRTKGSKDQGSKEPSADSPFEKFWKCFPSVRKTGKRKAEEAFGRAVKRADAETIIAAAVEFANSPKGKGEFCPMPTTWLNGDCWNDDRAAWGVAQGRLPTDEERKNWNPITGLGG